MPELDGVCFAEMSVSLKPSVKVVFMSGYPERHKSLCDEMFQNSICLSKPVDQQILLRVMSDALQNNIGAGGGEYETSTWQ
jgi:two-component SAPR family response regulator